jgi:hypothetical protein
MSTLVNALQLKFNDHVRGGGKQTRRKEVSRMIEFLEFAEAYEGVRTLQSLGKNQVIGFWKANRELSDETAYKYWLAIRKIWEWTGKKGLPPEPFKQTTVSENLQKKIIATSHHSDFLMAFQQAFTKQKITPLMLANITGLEEYEITAALEGRATGVIGQMADIVKTLSMQILSEQP